MIYTSYYARYKCFTDKSKYVTIAISNGVPLKGMIQFKLNELAPSWDLVQRHKAGKATNQDYIKEYTAQLEKLTCRNIYQTLKDIQLRYKGRELVLFCYESPEKFCHRHIFAEWFNQKLGQQIIKEYDYENC